jgi:hypothetical protein
MISRKPILTAISLLAMMIAGQSARADFSDNFSQPTPVGWTNATTPPPNFVGINDATGTGGTGFLQIVVRNTEFTPVSTYEGITHPINPVYHAPGSAWTASVQISTASTSKSLAASKEIHITTGSGAVYAFGLLAGTTNRSVNYIPVTDYMLEVWDAKIGSWVYLPNKDISTGNTIVYGGETSFTIQYIGNGVVNYWITNALSLSYLVYTQTGMDAIDPGISNPVQFGLGAFNFNDGGYNSFFQNASVNTFPNPIPNLNIVQSGNNVIISWPNTGTFTLQLATNLAASGGWLTNTNPVTLSNGTNSVNIAVPAGNKFFRLSLP